MVKIIKGKTIFDATTQTVVNTINCVGIMGKGLALEFKNRYPAMFDKYKSFCEKGVFKPGVLWIYKAPDGKWVLNFPTKVDWKNPSKIEYIEEGLKKFVEIWKEKEITSIAFPLLGCKNGGLNADEVIPLMEKYLNKCDGLEVYIYDDRDQVPQVEEKAKAITDEIAKSLKEFEENSPKEVVENATPLVDEEPLKSTLSIEESSIEQSSDDESEEKVNNKVESTDNTSDNIQEDKVEDEAPDEDAEILKEIIAERKAINNEVDKILEDFQKGDNSPEYRKTVARKIVNVVNRRGFPPGSVFQI